MKPGLNDVKLTILITGDELHELKRFTVEGRGFSELIDGLKRILASDLWPIGLYRWDLDCLLAGGIPKTLGMKVRRFCRFSAGSRGFGAHENESSGHQNSVRRCQATLVHSRTLS